MYISSRNEQWINHEKQRHDTGVSTAIMVEWFMYPVVGLAHFNVWCYNHI